MSGEILCDCGAVLVEEVTERGVKPVGSDEVIDFRRTTDYVLCTSCFKAYDARSLIANVAETDVIEHLERMALRTGEPDAE